MEIPKKCIGKYKFPITAKSSEEAFRALVNSDKFKESYRFRPESDPHDAEIAEGSKWLKEFEYLYNHDNNGITIPDILKWLGQKDTEENTMEVIHCMNYSNVGMDEEGCLHLKVF